jgi:hypothetical protein
MAVKYVAMLIAVWLEGRLLLFAVQLQWGQFNYSCSPVDSNVEEEVNSSREGVFS